MTWDRPDRNSLIPETFLQRSSAGALSDVERQLLSLIRIRAPITRPELARVTGLSLQTIVRVVATLMDRGLVSAGNKVITGRGQPSVPLSLARNAAYSIGFSITADTLTSALIELNGTILARSREPVDARDKPATLALMEAQVARLVSEAKIDRSRLFGAGAALSGFFRDGRINPPAGLESWAIPDLENEIGERIGLATWVENDGSAAAVGELLYGRGKAISTFGYIYIGAGLGGGLILDGRLWRGVRGNAGEFTGALAPDLRGERPTLRLLFEILAQEGRTFSTREDFRSAFDPSWPGVQTWLDRTTPTMTALLSAIGAILDPEAIVIGGELPPALSQALIARAAFHTVPVRGVERQFADLFASEIADDASPLGAAAIPFDHFFF